eukprot:TRINITY_DN21035_c0_g1_i1.p1 TRINITY_DN21035_c0_g1~~TRINITY_DN21035_c0_g1_i1.p1  ORF type:complete len:356 (-),score=56.18 TRINITY_DN21035_c0_g1_i1:252-1220(-)
MPTLGSFVLHGNPNPNPRFSLERASTVSSLGFNALRTHRVSVVTRFLHSTPFFVSLKLECRTSKLDRSRSIVSLAASHEESHSDVEVEKKKKLKKEVEEIQEAWQHTLESFKEQAIKMQSVSQEAYVLFSKNAMIILKQTSEQLKIQADKAKHDLGIVAKEISIEGREYLSDVAKNSPDSVKDIVETFTSTDELKEISEVHDFYLGIPYGAFLSIGGFLSFMLTGSISAIRFGVILGGALLTLSILSLRSYRSGKRSAPFLKGQAAIAAIIFIWLMRLCSQRPAFPTSIMTLISGAMLVFYIYRITLNGQKNGPSLEHGPEN